MKETRFLGYFKIKELPKGCLNCYQKLIGKVCKVYKIEGMEELICDVKGCFNHKSRYGFFYLPIVYKKGSLFGNCLEIYSLDCLTQITKEEYDRYLPEMKIIYLIKGYHPKDSNERIYHFKSNQHIKENTKIYVDTKYGKQELIVIDCKAILEDEETEFLKKLQLKKFRKVLSILEETEVIKKEVKEKPIEWK